MKPTTPRQRRSGDADRRAEMYRLELTERAGLFCRLGYAPSKAIARLQANVAWDFEAGESARPECLSDTAIADIVKSTYLRRPAR